VLAHLAPNPPAREGFRQSIDAGVLRPADEHSAFIQRARRLAATCRRQRHVPSSVVIGNAPRLIVVTANQAEDKSWRIAIGGTAPAMALHGRAGDTVALSLIADGSGAVGIAWPRSNRLGRHRYRRAAAHSAVTRWPSPAAPMDPGCDLVWLENPVSVRADVVIRSVRACSS
jgi:hypothetical protein